MLILFLVSLTGHALVHRKVISVAHDFAFPARLTRTISMISLAVISIFTLLWVSSPSLLWLFIGILLITLKFFSPILRFLLMKRLRAALIPVLDGVIMSLQAGRSFRTSLREACNLQSGWVRMQLIEVVESLSISKHPTDIRSAPISDFREELVLIEQSKSRCLEQVRALRRNLKIQQDFRRRSGQVTQQIKMQAIIVTALYCCLFGFVIIQFGFQPHRHLIFISLIVFFVGLIWIFSAGRRMKWRV